MASQSCHAPVPPSGKSSTLVNQTIKALSLSPDSVYHPSHQSPKMPIQKKTSLYDRLEDVSIDVGDRIHYAYNMTTDPIIGIVSEVIDAHHFKLKNFVGVLSVRYVYKVNDVYVRDM